MKTATERMRRRSHRLSIAAAVIAPAICVVQASPGPQHTAPVHPIAAPLDRAYPGAIQLSVDASDFQRRPINTPNLSAWKAGCFP